MGSYSYALASLEPSPSDVVIHHFIVAIGITRPDVITGVFGFAFSYCENVRRRVCN